MEMYEWGRKVPFSSPQPLLFPSSLSALCPSHPLPEINPQIILNLGSVSIDKFKRKMNNFLLHFSEHLNNLKQNENISLESWWHVFIYCYHSSLSSSLVIYWYLVHSKHTRLHSHLVKLSQLYKGGIIILFEQMKENGGQGYLCDLPRVTVLVTDRAWVRSPVLYSMHQFPKLTAFDKSCL